MKQFLTKNGLFCLKMFKKNQFSDSMRQNQTNLPLCRHYETWAQVSVIYSACALSKLRCLCVLPSSLCR